MDFAMEKTGHFLTLSTQFIDLWSLEHKRGKVEGTKQEAAQIDFHLFFIIIGVVSQGSDFSNPFSIFLLLIDDVLILSEYKISKIV